MVDLGKILIFVGGILVVMGFLVVALGKLPGLGRLPGDVLIKKEEFTFYFPITTSILISIFISLVLFLWNRK